MYGDYYIGGRQFDRLDKLISYYMYYSELVKDEKLVNPVAPAVVSRLERTCIAIKTYHKKKEQAPPPSQGSEELAATKSRSSQEIAEKVASSSVSRSNSSSNSAGGGSSGPDLHYAHNAVIANKRDSDEVEYNEDDEEPQIDDLVVEEEADEEEEEVEEDDQLVDEYEYDDDILYIESLGELFRVYHQIGEQNEWLWAQSYRTNECGVLQADCVKFVVPT